MQILELTLEKLGPFDRAHLEFVPAVTIITGKNGTGKSVVIDAIRQLFGANYGGISERSLRQREEASTIAARLRFEDGRPLTGADRYVVSSWHDQEKQFVSNDPGLVNLPQLVAQGRPSPGWIVDYWRPAAATDTHKIQGLAAIPTSRYLMGALAGTPRNAEVTELICHFDYLRDSREEREKRTGDVLYALTKQIIEASLLEGTLKHVERTTFTPVVHQSGYDVPLANLSAGNVYLIHRMLSLLSKMYAVHVLNGTEADTIPQTPGLLLIDEAEAHLHPLWQKRLLPTVRRLFPNVQIVATTHSPFVVASVADAKVYTCKFDRERQTCLVEEERSDFASKPVDEILASDAFAETPPFAGEIAQLMEDRKTAIAANDDAGARAIEARLKKANPEYFRFLDVDDMLRRVAGHGS